MEQGLNGLPERLVNIERSANAINTTGAADGAIIPEAEGALHGAILRSPIRVTLTCHSHGFTVVAMTPDEQRTVSAAHNKAQKVWELESGRELLTLKAYQNGVYGVTWSPDGKILLWVRGGGIPAYAQDIDLILSVTRSHITRDLTPEESQKYLPRRVPPIR